MADEPTGRPRCQAEIYVRDTYRVARGTKAGFRMHYNREQCRRAAADGASLSGADLCAQHRRIEDEGQVVFRARYPQPTVDPTLKPRKGKR